MESRELYNGQLVHQTKGTLLQQKQLVSTRLGRFSPLTIPYDK